MEGKITNKGINRLKTIKLSKIGILTFQLVIFVVLLIFFLFPYAYMFLGSLKREWDVMSLPPKLLPREWYFGNYAALFNEAHFDIYTRNSLIVSITVTLSSLFFVSLAGYSFAKFKYRGRETIFTLLMTSLMIPPESTMIPMYLIMHTFGLVDSLLALILPSLVSIYNIFLIRQYALNLPDSLFESARVDGCSEFKIYYKIFLPLCAPVLAVAATYTFLGTWNSFLWPLIVLTTWEKYTLPLGMVFTSSFGGTPAMAMRLAGATYATIPVVAVWLLAQKYFQKGIHLTGLKG